MRFATLAIARPLVESPGDFHYRSGSRYRFDPAQVYGNPDDDGHSRLFVPSYQPSLDPLIVATESLDTFLKPLAETEPRMVLGWFIHKDGISRTSPWLDFKLLPRDREVTSWPFYFLAGPEHNPGGEAVFTPLYLDPLSSDHMISCLSPVYIPRPDSGWVPLCFQSRDPGFQGFFLRKALTDIAHDRSHPHDPPKGIAQHDNGKFAAELAAILAQRRH